MGQGTWDRNGTGRGTRDGGRNELGWRGSCRAKTAANGDWRLATGKTAANGEWWTANGE
jgi:hypothetical protein